MKVAVVSDIHGNAPALQAVFQHTAAKQADRLACLGDIIGIYGRSGHCVAAIREFADYVVVGNHDTRLFPDRDYSPDGDVWELEYNSSMESISEDNLQWLRNQPAQLEEDGLVLAHCRPNTLDPTGAIEENRGILPREFTNVGKNLGGRVLLLGHTHYQHGVRLDKFDGLSGAVVNPGSVGDTLGEAQFAVVDTDDNTFELFSVEYDSSEVSEFLSNNLNP